MAVGESEEELIAVERFYRHPQFDYENKRYGMMLGQAKGTISSPVYQSQLFQQRSILHG